MSALAILLTFAVACRGRGSGVAAQATSEKPAVAPSRPSPEAEISPAPLPAELTTAEWRAVTQFLAHQPDLRPACDGDARPSDDASDLAKLYGVYHPYFVRGDLNDDGVLDFAICFVTRRKVGPAPWFSVVVFFGDRRGGFVEPSFVEREISLADGDLSIDRDSLLITPDVSQDELRRYRWNPSRREFEFVSGDDLPADRPLTNRV